MQPSKKNMQGKKNMQHIFFAPQGQHYVQHVIGHFFLSWVFFFDFFAGNHVPKKTPEADCHLKAA